MAQPASTPQKIAPAKQRGDAFVQAVLEATLTELAANGFDKLSMPRIAGIAGANKTSLYRRWPCKLELVRDALASIVSPAAETPNTDSLQGDLLALASHAAAFMQSPSGAAIVQIMLAQSQHPELRKLAQATYQNASQQAPFIVMQRAIQRGDIKADIDPAQVLFTIAGAIMHRVFVERQLADEAFLEQVVAMVLGGAGVSR